MIGNAFLHRNNLIGPIFAHEGGFTGAGNILADLFDIGGKPCAVGVGSIMAAQWRRMIADPTCALVGEIKRFVIMKCRMHIGIVGQFQSRQRIHTAPILAANDNRPRRIAGADCGQGCPESFHQIAVVQFVMRFIFNFKEQPVFGIGGKAQRYLLPCLGQHLSAYVRVAMDRFEIVAVHHHRQIGGQGFVHLFLHQIEPRRIDSAGAVFF